MSIPTVNPEVRSELPHRTNGEIDESTHDIHAALNGYRKLGRGDSDEIEEVIEWALHPDELQIDQEKKREVEESITWLLERVSGLEGEELEELANNPNESFRKVFSYLDKEIYQGRAIENSHGSYKARHFATRNPNRDGIDLHFSETIDGDDEPTFMTLNARLHDVLQYPVTIQSSPNGELTITMDDFKRSQEVAVEMKPEEEAQILAAVFVDIADAMHSHDKKSDEQIRADDRHALRLLKKELAYR